MHDVAFKDHQAKDPEVNMIDAKLQTISWSPNGTHIVTASRSINTFRGNISFLWDPNNANDKVQQLQGGVHTATYSPNGKYIITNAQEENGLGNIRNTTRLWDLQAQQFVEIARGDVVRRCRPGPICREGWLWGDGDGQPDNVLPNRGIR